MSSKHGLLVETTSAQTWQIQQHTTSVTTTDNLCREGTKMSDQCQRRDMKPLSPCPADTHSHTGTTCTATGLALTHTVTLALHVLLLVWHWHTQSHWHYMYCYWSGTQYWQTVQSCM